MNASYKSKRVDCRFGLSVLLVVAVAMVSGTREGVGSQAGSATTTLLPPIPCILVNGQGNTLSLSNATAVTISVELSAGSYAGYPADWWVAAETPSGWYSFQASSWSWVPGLVVSHQGGLYTFGATPLLQASGLPSGTYQIYFAVDGRMNGVLDSDVLVYDVVTFCIGGALIPAPVAAFSFSPTTPIAGQTVQFTDISTRNPTAWSWTFGDGSASTSQSPAHAYSAAGSYAVTLITRNPGGSNMVSRTVSVSASGSAPVAAYSFFPSAPSTGHTVSFVDTSTNAPTSWIWSFGDGSSSTSQCPSHAYSTAGTYSVALTVANAGGANTLRRTMTVSSPVFNMSQTVSDVAQRTTLAFSGLAMMTGNLESQSFFPPGKVADYTGFQFLRDNDPDSMGHNTSFLTRVANNIIYILNDSQFEQLKTLATNQIDQINLYGYMRFPLMKAFRRLLDGDIPSGSTGLNLNAVKDVSRALYMLDGQISFDRALLYANILSSMTTTQKAYLNAMKGKGWSSWPNITDAQIRSRMSSLPQGTAVAVMTYAGDLFSWYSGSVEADVYFCPERQGTYYGSFYIKDAPAIGHEGYSINEQLTATAGAALCDSSKGYVTAGQATLMSSLVATQKGNLYAGATNIVTARAAIATLLRSLLTSTASSNSVQAQVQALSGIYGNLDGENNYNYATVFTQFYGTLTADQKTSIAALRESIMSGTYSDGTPFDYSVCTTPFLYSSVITNVSVLAPYIADTDYLFFEP